MLFKGLEEHNPSNPSTNGEEISIRQTETIKKVAQLEDDRVASKPVERSDGSKHSFEHGGKIYHISIIDYLQTWTFEKKIERASKILLRGVDGDQLSAIEPDEYATRFMHFMEKKVFTRNN